MVYWRVLVVLVSSVLLACSGARPPDLRTPQEMAAPSPEDWHAAARGLAEDLAKDLGARSPPELASVAPVEGGAPPYFRDLLLASLIEHGVQIAEADKAEAAPHHIECRSTPVGVLPNPRGLTTAPAPLPNEILVLCLVAQDGAYVGIAERSLHQATSAEAPATGVVIEVTQ